MINGNTWRCDFCGEHGHRESACALRCCHVCGSRRHIAADCPRLADTQAAAILRWTGRPALVQHVGGDGGGDDGEGDDGRPGDRGGTM